MKHQIHWECLSLTNIYLFAGRILKHLEVIGPEFHSLTQW